MCIFWTCVFGRLIRRPIQRGVRVYGFFRGSGRNIRQKYISILQEWLIANARRPRQRARDRWDIGK
jgi:hypothetical protein